MKRLIYLLTAFFLITSCSEDSNEPTLITSLQYNLIVASKKVQAEIVVDGVSTVAETFAVKTSEEGEWQAYPVNTIIGFDYLPSYEYEITVNEDTWASTSTIWTEYSLNELVSKTLKESEGLPETFIE